MTVMGPDGLNRFEPALPVTAVKTYQITNPMRPATCEEVDCGYYLNGWATIIPASQAPMVRELCRGRYSCTETAQPGGLVEFVFGPGQHCFRASEHRLPWDGRERFWERGGDWRGQTSPTVQHSPDGWLDSFGEHQDRLKQAYERG